MMFRSRRFHTPLIEPDMQIIVDCGYKSDRGQLAQGHSAGDG